MAYDQTSFIQGLIVGMQLRGAQSANGGLLLNRSIPSNTDDKPSDNNKEER